MCIIPTSCPHDSRIYRCTNYNLLLLQSAPEVEADGEDPVAEDPVNGEVETPPAETPAEPETNGEVAGAETSAEGTNIQTVSW